MAENKSDLLKSLFEKDVSMEEVNKITETIIGCTYKVGNELGCGFLEKIYENALAYEIRKNGLEAEQQKEIKVY